MNTLYYGSGVCTIEGVDILGVSIRYNGNIVIDDKTPSDFRIIASRNNISIFSLKNPSIKLNELFEYKGRLKILSARAFNEDGNKVSTIIKRVMDYSQLLDSKAEDLTVKSEDLSAGYGDYEQISSSKQIIKSQDITDLHTDFTYGMVDSNGNEYIGNYHMNMADKIYMSGGSFSENSVYLKMIPDPKAVRRNKNARRTQRRRAWRTKT